ncbi:MAG: hypothetical protein EOP85_18130 [Verrucomicrobiaceae bacterium]|nr:MAG: hypothetical protein EOP85_18130 [Verrucomicrobiaceae bacterium]
MKTILFGALAAVSMIASAIAGPIPKNTTVKLELVSITKIDNNKIKPGMKYVKNAPSTLKVGKVYSFKMGGTGKLTGPGGVNIAYATSKRLNGLNLNHLKIPGVSNFYLDYKGSSPVNASLEFGAAFQNGNKGKPVAITLTYMDVKASPSSVSTKSVTYVFESVSK